VLLNWDNNSPPYHCCNFTAKLRITSCDSWWGSCHPLPPPPQREELTLMPTTYCTPADQRLSAPCITILMHCTCDISFGWVQHMGTRRHGKRGHLPPPPRNIVKCLCMSSYNKTLTRRLFTQYFHNLSSASRGFAPRPPLGLHPWTLLGDFHP